MTVFFPFLEQIVSGPIPCALSPTTTIRSYAAAKKISAKVAAKATTASTKKSASVSPKKVSAKKSALEPVEESPKKVSSAKKATSKSTVAKKVAKQTESASPPSKKTKAVAAETEDKTDKVKAKKTASSPKSTQTEAEPASRPRGRPKRSLSAPVVPEVETPAKVVKRVTSKKVKAVEAEEVVLPTKSKKSASVAKAAAISVSDDAEKPKRGRPKKVVEVEVAKPSKRSKSVPPPLPADPEPIVAPKGRAKKLAAVQVSETAPVVEKTVKTRSKSTSAIVPDAPEVPQNNEEFVITDQLVDLIGREMDRPARIVRNTLELLLEGNTVPFITRYRKEMIGEMDETDVRNIHKQALQYAALQQRKQTVLETIRTLNKLTPELEREIMETISMRHLEDLYAPYKPKKNSLADIAISKGLLEVAEKLLARSCTNTEIVTLLKPLIDESKDLKSIEDVITGIQHIWAEKVSDSVLVRDAIRPIYAEFGTLSVSENPSAPKSSEPTPSTRNSGKEKKEVPTRKRSDTYAYYFNFSKPLSALRSHNVMAINRGEREKFLKVKFSAPEPEILSAIAASFAKQHPHMDKMLSHVTSEFATLNSGDEGNTLSMADVLAKLSESSSSDSKQSSSEVKLADGDSKVVAKKRVSAHSIHETLLRDAILDGFKRLLHPSMVKESRNAITEEAETASIVTFGKNLKALLLKPPVVNHVILGLDPGFSHGCKTCIVDENGKVLETKVIFPFVGESRLVEKLREFDAMVRKHHVTLVAIGNGTAHKQAINFIKIYKEKANSELNWCVVDESGASVYSVSPEAQAEFPDLDPAGRGAASIARRTLDPMAEIVKIPTQSIGVGSYQHDVNQKELSQSLSSVVEDCVNFVGVNLNTASQPLLRRVSGLSPSQASAIVKYRDLNGGFQTRSQLEKVKGIGPRTFTQCAGFLRIPESTEPLDNTNIHPESYTITNALLKSLNFKSSSITDPKKKQKLHDALASIDIKQKAAELGIGEPTLADIIENLKKPGRDPRASAQIVQLDNQISDFAELKVGMTLLGRIVNVTGFGAFVDVGIEHSGLVLPKDVIDPVTNLPVKSYNSSVSPGYVGNFEVLAVDETRKRFQLRLFLSDTSNLM